MTSTPPATVPQVGREDLLGVVEVLLLAVRHPMAPFPAFAIATFACSSIISYSDDELIGVIGPTVQSLLTLVMQRHAHWELRATAEQRATLLSKAFVSLSDLGLSRTQLSVYAHLVLSRCAAVPNVMVDAAPVLESSGFPSDVLQQIRGFVQDERSIDIYLGAVRLCSSLAQQSELPDIVQLLMRALWGAACAPLAAVGAEAAEAFTNALKTHARHVNLHPRILASAGKCLRLRSSQLDSDEFDAASRRTIAFLDTISYITANTSEGQLVEFADGLDEVCRSALESVQGARGLRTTTAERLRQSFVAVCVAI
mmetsp:Transcript_48708/g.137033  ORF Transcript_48708/g.137033 Transcript_48708/m.137033 type:complete len:312 (+) Transcript_48708:3-938(+)